MLAAVALLTVSLFWAVKCPVGCLPVRAQDDGRGVDAQSDPRVSGGRAAAHTRRPEIITRSRDYFRAGPPRLRAIARAMELLPEPPAAVQVFSVDDAAPALRRRLAALDAFVARGKPVVYLTKHSPVLQRASGGSVFHTYVLAAIIWHEMAHLSGADEAGAREREEVLWRQFLLDNHLDRNMALAYQRNLSSRGPALRYHLLSSGSDPTW